MLNICFVQLQLPDDEPGRAMSCYLRMRYEGPDGLWGEPSQETDAVHLRDALKISAAAHEALRRETMRKGLRRPQQLTICGGSQSLWEAGRTPLSFFYLN